MKRSRELLQQLAGTDALTGLPNRRHFDHALLQEIQRQRRHGGPLSLFIVDVDHFKRYNDRYGHPAGDECLRKVAQAISSVLKRPSDLAARLGGEEFGSLLPETDAPEAIALAEQSRLAVARLALPHDASGTADHVSVSVGVATLVASGEATAEALYQAADANLYRAKEAGRNRVMGPAGAAA
jgi:diguanylate cyclase (GGDEF)-like protein